MLALSTSVLHPYPLIWRRDPALMQPDLPPEVAPLPDESPADFEARKAKREAEALPLLEAFERAWARAVETRQWDELKRPGATPTVFWCRQLPRFRAFLDYANDERNHVGPLQRAELAFRLAVTRIDNPPVGLKVEHVEHVDARGAPTGLGKVLSEDTVDALDLCAPGIVVSLGTSIFLARLEPPPL